MREGLLVAGKYKLLKLIGTGGMGAVWLARNEMTEREFAIKFLHPQAAANPKVLSRFLQEAKVSGRLRHPSILEIFDVGIRPELEGAPFLVMELLDGAPLDVAIRLLGGLPLRLTLQIALAMSRALAVAHEKGVVHRDLKPANVFLHRTPSGGVLPKLLDFGISKLSPLDTSSGEGMGLTQTGAVLGSPLYMSPEQAAGDKHVDGRSDIHALGVLMWWCIVGKSPFKSQTYNTLVVEIITGERPKLLEVKPDVPTGVSDIVTKAFARRREDRFDDTRKLAEALEAEVAALGPGPSLESREWVEDIFTKLRVTSGSSELRPPQEPKEMTTNGAVSVSIDDILPASSEMRSPAAYTMDSKRAIALAPTEASPLSHPSRPGLAVQSSTMSSSAGTTKRVALVPLIAASILGVFVLGGIGIGVMAMRSSGGAAASSGTTTATADKVTQPPSAPATPGVGSALSVVTPKAEQAPATDAPDAGAPQASPPATATVVTGHGGYGGRQTTPPNAATQSTGRQPPTTTPPAQTPPQQQPAPDDPFHHI